MNPLEFHLIFDFGKTPKWDESIKKPAFRQVLVGGNPRLNLKVSAEPPLLLSGGATQRLELSINVLPKWPSPLDDWLQNTLELILIKSQWILKASQYVSMSIPEKSFLLVGLTKGFGRDTLTRFGISGN
jgi:hypothetical protein